MGTGADLEHQHSLTRLLENARPQYKEEPIRSVLDFLDRITGITDLPLVLGSYGVNWDDVRQL